ncbi:Hypothetical protein A7982_04620 [Minicystis rosea]|nr:Hypothetical protein A7982_04620 [Minicystis rosea]
MHHGASKAAAARQAMWTGMFRVERGIAEARRGKLMASCQTGTLHESRGADHEIHCFVIG